MEAKVNIGALKYAIKQRSDIAKVFSALGVETTPTPGGALSALCFEHEEIKPSLHISPEQNLWHCFGCGAGGDDIELVRRHENKTYLESVLWLAKLYSIEEDKFPGGKREGILDLIVNAAAPADDQMPTWAKEYLSNHGVSYSWAGHFGLRYVESGNWIVGRLDEIDKGQDWMLKSPAFQDAILYPLQWMGRVCRLYGRTKEGYFSVPSSVVDKDAPRIFGFDPVPKPAKSIILVEGPNDVIACSAAGMNNVVGVMGNVVSYDDIKLLMDRGVMDITILFDGDDGGKRGLARVLDRCMLIPSLYVAICPDGGDPAEHIVNSGTAKELAEAVRNRKAIVDYFADGVGPSLTDRQEILGRIANKIRRSEVPVGVIADTLSLRLGVGRDWIYSFLSKYTGRAIDYGAHEHAIISHMIKDEILRHMAAIELDAECFSSQDNKKLFNVLSKQTGELDVALLVKLTGKDEAWCKQIFDTQVGEFKKHLDLIKEGRVRETLNGCAIRLTSAASSGDIQEAGSVINEVAKALATTSKSSMSGPIVSNLMSDIYERAALGKDLVGEPLGTGWDAISQLMKGVQDGIYMAVLGDTGVGKSVLGTNWMVSLGTEIHVPVCFLSMEMATHKLMLRALSIMTGLDIDDVELGRVTKEQAVQLDETAEVLTAAPIYMVGPSDLTSFEKILAQIRRHTLEFGVKVFILDYIQLIRMQDKEHKRSSRWEQLVEISLELKSTAPELGVCLICLGQLNRDAAQGRSTKKQVGGGYQIVQDADWVFILDWLSNDAVEASETSNRKLTVDKARSGRSGETVPLYMDERTLKMREAKDE